MSFFTKKKICVTHNGTFHTDDLFATAILSILNNGSIKIIRTRDPEIFKMGDYTYDVGGENNPEKNKFDHHQKGGGGKRDNGIPYSSFGLIWKKFGEEICGSKEVSDLIDLNIVQSIDAKDNGVDISKSIYVNVFPYSVEQIFLSAVPTWEENNKDINKIFKKQVRKAVDLLKREIEIAKADVRGKNTIIESYEKSEDKRLIIVGTDFPRYLFQDILSKFTEPIYFVYPSSHSTGWKVEAIKKSPDTMESRKLFPEEWRGSMEESGRLKEITGVPDAQFCHQNGFFLTVGSKEGAIKLAQKALIA
jgi:uncharacterized UPF0160 family protein